MARRLRKIAPQILIFTLFGAAITSLLTRSWWPFIAWLGIALYFYSIRRFNKRWM